MFKLSPLEMLVATTALFSAMQVTYILVEITPEQDTAMLTQLAFGLAFPIWVVADAAERRQTPSYDFGLFAYLFFPATLIWYVFWSRGWRGFLMLGLLFGLMLLPTACGVIVATIRAGLVQ